MPENWRERARGKERERERTRNKINVLMLVPLFSVYVATCSRYTCAACINNVSSTR